MKTTAAFALAAAATLKLAAAHSTPIAIWVNGEDQGVGNAQDGSGYMRTPPNNSPVTDVTSKDMTCNVGGATAASKFVDVKGGDKIDIEWHHNTRGDDIIDLSHKGPVMTYIAPADSNGEGNVWVKLAEEGLSNGKWAVENLVANKGKHSVTLPDLAAGEYLLRPEIIALHEGNRPNGAQLYMDCIQIKVSGSGSVSLPEGVAIPGAYTAEDDGILFDLYNNPTTYSIPGPAVWDGASGGTPTPPNNETETLAPSSTANPTPVSSSTPAPTSAAPVETPSATAPSTPAPTQGSGNGNDSNTLPESFTLDTFISWLRKTAGSANAKRRVHARQF